MAQWQLLELVNRFESLDSSMGRNSTSFWLRPFLAQEAFSIGEHRRGFLAALDGFLHDRDNGGARWTEMLRLRRDARDGALLGVERTMFATASMLRPRPGEQRISWTARARLQDQWRHIAHLYRHWNVSVFQVYGI